MRTRKLDGLGGKEQKQFALGRATTVTNSIIAGEVATISGKQLIPILFTSPTKSFGVSITLQINTSLESARDFTRFILP